MKTIYQKNFFLFIIIIIFYFFNDYFNIVILCEPSIIDIGEDIKNKNNLSNYNHNNDYTKYLFSFLIFSSIIIASLLLWRYGHNCDNSNINLENPLTKIEIERLINLLLDEAIDAQGSSVMSRFLFIKDMLNKFLNNPDLWINLHKNEIINIIQEIINQAGRGG